MKVLMLLLLKIVAAAATEALHNHELEIINMIYCHVVNINEVKSFFVS